MEFKCQMILANFTKEAGVPHTITFVSLNSLQKESSWEMGLIRRATT